MKLNVRCCCQPAKILGTLEVSEENVRRMAFNVALRQPYAIDDVRITQPVVRARINLRTFINPFTQSEIAVYGDDRPLEFWKNIPGFTEAPK